MSFEKEFESSKEITLMIADYEIAQQFYAALCNVEWTRKRESSEDETARALLGDKNAYSCTWRYAGGFIAQLRNSLYNKEEDYLDFYCSGSEGVVSPLVEDALEKIGWKPVYYDQNRD